MNSNHVNRRDFLKVASLGFAGTSLLPFYSCSRSKTDFPNIIYIIADDLGYGDLSCYGQTKYSTPNIDRLANEGKKFTQHYAGSTVCAPSRSVLMTGLHTGHTPIRGNKRVTPEGQVPLPANYLTLAQMLKDGGYVTGAFGKWGLGFIENEGSPLKRGFDKFYGYYCQSLAHRYYPLYLWENENKINLKNDGTNTIEFAADLIQNQALKFIETNKDNKFFCYLPYTIPHAELIVPEDKIIAKYRGKFLPEKVFKGRDYGEDYNPYGYCSQEESHAVFAALVDRLDIYVGEILNKLKELGIDNNTIVCFTSDNGPHKEGGADPDYFDSNGPLTGYKRDVYEGGIRVPFLVRWPANIQPGSESTHPSAFWDVLPTLAEVVGLAVPKNIDGISFLPALLGKKQKKHDYLYWEFLEQGGKQAVRMGDWKGIRFGVQDNPNGPIQLFNLNTDIAEENDVSKKHPDIVVKIEQIMKEAHQKSDLFPFKFES
jgi:arylsulfatase A-like enzyme